MPRNPSPRSRPGFEVPLGTHFPSSFAEFAAQNRKGIVGQRLTDFEAARNRCETFRFFPKLSVSFRPDASGFRAVPEGSGACRWVRVRRRSAGWALQSGRR